MPPRPPVGLLPMDVDALQHEVTADDIDTAEAEFHTPRPQRPAAAPALHTMMPSATDLFDDDVPPPAPQNRQLRSSPEAARRRGLAPLGTTELRNAPPQTLATAVAGVAPAPPPPATDRGYLPNAVARAVAVNTGQFRMAVWSYSPAKKRPQSSAIRVNQSCLNRQLTNDLIGIVFGYLSISDLAVASQVCRGWFVSADPWAYVEQHGWIPLGPLTRAECVVLRFAPSDNHVAPQLLRCLRHHCQRLVLHLGNGVAAASVALPPYVARSEESPPLAALTSLTLERPSPEDLRMIRERLAPRLPALRNLTIERISLPIGARDIVILMRSCKALPIYELRLIRVTNLTRSCLSEIFNAVPTLCRIVLDQCVLALDNAGNQHQQQQQQQNVFRPITSNPALTGRPVAGTLPPPTAATKTKVTATLVPSEASVWGFVVMQPAARRGSTSGPSAPKPNNSSVSARSGRGGGQNGGRPALLTPEQMIRRPLDSPRSRSVQPPPGAALAADCTDCLVQGMPCAHHMPPMPSGPLPHQHQQQQQHHHLAFAGMPLQHSMGTGGASAPSIMVGHGQQYAATSTGMLRRPLHSSASPPPQSQLQFAYTAPTALAPNSGNAAPWNGGGGGGSTESAPALPRFPAPPPPISGRPFIPVHPGVVHSHHRSQHQQHPLHHHQPHHHHHPGVPPPSSLHGFFPSLPPLIAVPPQSSGSSRQMGVAGSLWGAPSALPRPAPPAYSAH